jgi:Fe2+ transport system protein B
MLQLQKIFVVSSVFNPQTVGYVIFFVILFVIFQSIFEWSKVPMDFIDSTFASLSTLANNELPAGFN